MYLSVSIADIPDDLDTSHVHLLSVKLSGIARKYHSLGILLGIHVAKLREIEALSPDSRIFLANILNEWRKERRPLTDIIMAVRSSPINNQELASELEQKWSKEGYSESQK